MSFSINHLGNNGHLGNQMFQYAFVKSMSVKHSRSFCIPPSSVFGKYYYQKLFSNIDECFDIKCNRLMSGFPSVVERSFHFDEDLFENPPEKDVNYVGYFQSEKYFKHIESELRKDFTFRDDILNSCKEIMNNHSDVIGIHIRRNDFLTNPNHPVQPNSYYEQALNEFDKDLPVMVFSDDPKWCFQQKMFDGDRFMISETYDAYYDLCLMNLCSHHIICNSTFSWWGSWLAKSKKTVAPKIWFAGENATKDLSDLYLPEWIII